MRVDVKESFSILESFICPCCHQVERIGYSYTRSHIFAGAEVTHQVCYWCSEQEPCTQTFSGVHAQIEDLGEFIEGGPISDFKGDMPWFLVEVPIQPDQYGRVGRCIMCHKWQIWDVANQAWVDGDLIY